MANNHNVGEQTARQRLIEELYTMKYNKEMKIPDIMKQLYVTENKTQKEISEELHISIGTVNKWLTRAGISGKKMVWI